MHYDPPPPPPSHHGTTVGSPTHVKQSESTQDRDEKSVDVAETATVNNEVAMT